MTPEQEAINDRRDDIHKFIIALLILILDFGIMGVLLFIGVPDKNKDIVNFAVGTMFGATLSRVVGDYFKGQSKDKAKAGAVVTDNVETVNTNTP